ncbi:MULTISPECIES: hypothetical protein [unclassified Mycobacterium]|uniref:hypothetical protein n=1 Tax=unclassified Mycobacterium TaxID=2642494 RepID=UPI0029C62937|nr:MULTISPECIES: hypothetical protein [unclassified Mycobacterium]
MSKKATRPRSAHWRLGSSFDRSQRRGVDAYVLAWEDADLPVELRFAPPLVELGWAGPFEYHWQLLTLAFSLPDPAAFPPMSGFSAEELAGLNRYATVCAEVAGSSVLRHHGGMAVNAVDGHVSYEPVPAPSAFEGFATRFRQLHFGHDGGPGFDSVASILDRHARRTEDAHCADRVETLAQWNQARSVLRQRPLKNVAARSTLRRHRRSPGEAKYDGVRPDDVLAEFDCGSVFADRTSMLDPPEPYQEHVFMISVLGLCHLYFGYAVLVRSAYGGNL